MRGSSFTPAQKRRAAQKLTRGLRGIVLFLFITSGIINVLALTGAFYMLQIYDRALTSGSIPTLVALSILAVGLYFFQGLFDIIRSQVLVRIGARLDKRIAPSAHQVAIDMPRFGFSAAEALERGRDVDTVRSFLGSQGPISLFDLPWMPLYLIFVYFLHPLLGALTFAGAFILTVLTILTEILTRRLSGATQQTAVERNAIADSNARNAEVIKAMGMTQRVVARFSKVNSEHLRLHAKASDISGTFGAISRVLRMILQSAILGLGAYLTIRSELSAGGIIAASVIAARALAPVDSVIGNWKGIVAAREAYKRLKETVIALGELDPPMPLPPPRATLHVEKITVAAPDSGRILLTDVDFQLQAGDGLGIIGPSGGGKTTLVRALIGIWPPLRGSIRLDGAELTQWQEEVLGTHIGYLPQDVSLLEGTIEENISRFDPLSDPRATVAAARAAGVHEMIVRLPEGYRTRVGVNGAALSAGQRQRIGLARALYKDPFLVVLDEPNSNLDSEGEGALTEAIRGIRARGGIVVVVAHRPSALVALNLIAVIQQGRMTAFGPKEEIIGAREAPTSSANCARQAATARVPA